jgi:hypothetical protein
VPVPEPGDRCRCRSDLDRCCLGASEVKPGRDTRRSPKESPMQLRIVDDIVHTIGIIHGLCRVIARQDPDLGKQMKRAVNSLGLNSGEGLSARPREIDTLDRLRTENQHSIWLGHDACFGVK